VSSRWRLARLALYRRVVQSRGLRGVILAHHADDQAETIFHRLVRGSSPAGLRGMVPQTTLSGLTVLRPLLGVPREALRAYLASQQQDWREDVSNASPRYARNRIRRLLTARPRLTEPLLELGTDCRRLQNWLDAQAPSLDDSFLVTDVRALPLPIARRALLRWLRQRSPVPVEPASAERLAEMALDAASPARQHFPGGVLVCRRQGQIFIA
jgi:tRNA(Ile)-lysidine synthase